MKKFHNKNDDLAIKEIFKSIDKTEFKDNIQTAIDLCLQAALKQ